MRKRLVFASVIALLAMGSSVAWADDCTWSPQGGTLHGACKDSAGKDYCLSCPASGGSCSKVPCPTNASTSGR